MTNEEKMLDILAGMSLRMDAIESRMATRDDIENESLKINIRMETDLLPKLDALAEGHSAILEQLVPTSRVDDLESRVKFLETMLRPMSEEIYQLRKAQ